MSKIFGIPLAFILLVLVIVLPLLAVDLIVFRSVNEVKEQVLEVRNEQVRAKVQEMKENTLVTPTITPSPTIKQPAPQKSPTSTGSAER